MLTCVSRSAQYWENSLSVHKRQTLNHFRALHYLFESNGRIGFSKRQSNSSETATLSWYGVDITCYERAFAEVSLAMPIITPRSLYVLNVSLSSITYYKWNVVTSIDCVIYRHIIDNQLKFTHCKEHMLQNGHVCAYLTIVASALFNFGVTISLSLAPVPVTGHSSGLKVH